ncbi:hypothetical protein [Edaphobacillus lindanitolerans]|uniref:Uncharacterized protein n=1 Tax=Edaphobacillus lindanitolerans TaxID=550447 RepID=A0A1U7PQ44_9BACI|nr:hypothetical protein [Edaphobacillus lindanitolerans]SIT91660.1 hypothetical protein SAMN05428946_2719 [Edaphobacillus lindanitolerans]
MESRETGEYAEEAKKFEEAMRRLWEFVSERFRDRLLRFTEAMSEVQELIDRERALRATWTVCMDNRRPHQVLDRRPAFGPRKLL